MANGEDFERCEDRRETFMRAFLRAVLAHVYIAWIHPFGDGNGRGWLGVGVLTAAGVPAISAQLLSNHYSATRDAYYRQLSQASRWGGELTPFLRYAVERFVEGLEEQLERVRQVNYISAWREYVDELFAGPSTTAKRRRRELVLALPTKEPVKRAEIERLSPELAALYAGKQSKTVTRDLNAIEEMGLIERGRRGFGEGGGDAGLPAAGGSRGGGAAEERLKTRRRASFKRWPGQACRAPRHRGRRRFA